MKAYENLSKARLLSMIEEARVMADVDRWNDTAWILRIAMDVALRLSDEELKRLSGYTISNT